MMDRFFPRRAGRVLPALALSLGLAVPPLCGDPTAPAADPALIGLQDSFARVAAAVKPSVVSITTVQTETFTERPFEFYFGDPYDGEETPKEEAPRGHSHRHRSLGMGSGVIVTPEGHILTNEHVVRGATEIKVTLQVPMEKTYVGKVVGKDPRTDLAVVKIVPKEPLVAAKLGDSRDVRVGDWAIAVGSPFGLEQTVTVGIVSAVRQSLDIEGRSYSDLFQTDAAINRGNSGGPLVNVRGEVIGVNTAIYAPTGVFAGVGFAIPLHRAKEIMDQLIAKGRVVRGWMGVEIAGLDDVLARQFRLPDKEGVMVNNVLPRSPSEAADLRRGDVIRTFNGRKVAGQEALIDMVGHTPPKSRVTVGLVRDGRPLEVTLVTGEMPSEDEPEPAAPAGGADERAERWEGARVMNVAPGPARRYNLPADARGVVVTDVDVDGAAESIGLEEGDLIVSVNRDPTPDLAAFRKAAGKADLSEGVLLDVNRRGRWIYLSYKEE